MFLLYKPKMLLLYKLKIPFLTFPKTHLQHLKALFAQFFSLPCLSSQLIIQFTLKNKLGIHTFAMEFNRAAKFVA